MARVIRSRSVLAAAFGALALAAVGGLSVGHAVTPPDLPPVAPDQLIASALQAMAERTPVSGTVRSRVDLGIPQLPAGLNDPAGPAGALLGDQTFKVWYGADGTRVAQILPFAERVLVANPTDVWFWDSGRFTAWHVAIGASRIPPETPSLGDLEGLVAKVLNEVRPYADVAVAVPTTVAGRDAYVLALTPRSPDTVVGRIEVDIDAESRLPIRAAVFARSTDDPSIEAGFTWVDFGPVDPAMLAFSPPPGATVKAPGGYEGYQGSGGPAGEMPAVRTFGEGFGLIVAVRVSEVPKEMRSLLPYAGPLGSAILVDRGDHVWVLAGAVAPDALEAAALKLP